MYRFEIKKAGDAETVGFLYVAKESLLSAIFSHQPSPRITMFFDIRAFKNGIDVESVVGFKETKGRTIVIEVTRENDDKLFQHLVQSVNYGWQNFQYDKSPKKPDGGYYQEQPGTRVKTSVDSMSSMTPARQQLLQKEFGVSQP